MAACKRKNRYYYPSPPPTPRVQDQTVMVFTDNASGGEVYAWTEPDGEVRTQHISLLLDCHGVPDAEYHGFAPLEAA